MKIAYNSVSPTVKSGYGRCTAELVYRLLDEHDVDIYAYYGIQQSEITVDLSGKRGVKTVRVVGGDGSIYHPILPSRQNEYDVIIAHWDLWMATFNPTWLNSIKTPIIWWAIVDHIPLPHPVRRLLQHPALLRAVPMTEWAKKLMLEACERDLIPTDIVANPIPHGVDPDEWRPVSNPKIPKVPDDAEFVVCSVVANVGMRENIPTMIEAFAIFLRETEADAYYYIHAEPLPPRNSSGFNLYEVTKSIGELYGVELKDRVLFKATYARLPDEFIRNVYSRADVHLLTIMGGSFEIPVLEAACCGTPSIVTDFSGPAELVGEGEGFTIRICERGIAVKPSAWVWMNLSSAKQAQVRPDDVAKALEIYYYNPNLRKKHADAMLRWIRKNATWDIVAEKWLRLLEDAEAQIKSNTSRTKQ